MAPNVEILELLDLGNDVLLVRGTIEGVTMQVEREVKKGRRKVRESVDEPVVLQAQGWISAFENHYPADAYDEDGALKLKREKKDVPGDPVHEPRAMTSDERNAYAKRLLLEQNPVPTPIPL